MGQGRVANRLDRLLSQEYLLTRLSKKFLRRDVRNRFKERPQAKELPLSLPHSRFTNKRDYHSQHIQLIRGQAGGVSLENLLTPLDEITASLGGFSFYAVPFGVARKMNRLRFEITIDRVGIHVIDSFDFSGTQYLGCWAKPRHISKIHVDGIPGLRCLFNNSFRHYRFTKARGGDFNLFMKPYMVTISPPYVVKGAL